MTINIEKVHGDMIDNNIAISLRVKDELSFPWITVADAKDDNPVSFQPSDSVAAQNYTVTFESFDMWGSSGQFPTLRSDVITVVVTKPGESADPSDSGNPGQSGNPGESVDPNKKGPPDENKDDDKAEDKEEPADDDKEKEDEAAAEAKPTCSLDANKDRSLQVALDRSPIQMALDVS